MKQKVKAQAVEKKKIIAIVTLSITSIIIMLLGISFSIYSLINDVSFSVLNSNVHGAVFGGVSIFLGLRYFLSVMKLKAEVYKSSSKFSWSNFKRAKKQY